jgi:HD superfamily phosphodiesterase
MNRTKKSRLPNILERLRDVISKNGIPDDKRDIPIVYELSHVFTCSHIAQLLALKRGITAELAGISAAMHDLGRILYGRNEKHAEKGYLPAKDMLKEMGIFSWPEIETISAAIKHHSEKETFGTNPYDEIVKDADALDCYLVSLEVLKESHKKRLNRIFEDLGIKRQV